MLSDFFAVTEQEDTEEDLVEEIEGNESPTGADEEQETVAEEEEQSNN